MLRPTLTLLAVLLVALPGCDTQQPDCPGAPSCPGPGPGVPDIVAGVDLTALFAAPTGAERDSVAARLAQTGGTGASRVTAATATTLAPDPVTGAMYTLVTLKNAAGQTVTSAVARSPALDLGGGGPLPVLFILPDGAGAASDEDFLTGESAQGLDRRTVQIVLADRGAALTTRGVTAGSPARTVRPSEVPADPYRADVLDLLALTQNLGSVPRADASRLGATGVGRGGAVALLAAERAPGRFKAIVPLSAPTSLFEATFRLDVRSALTGGSPGRLPAAETLVAPALALSRGQISLQEARLRMLELSATALPGRLPPTHAYHAATDDVVPLAHLARLREAVGLTTEPILFDPVPEVTHDTIFSNTSVRGLIADFFNRYLIGLLPT